MARKLHLAVMTDTELEAHRRWIRFEQAAVLAEAALRQEAANVGLDAQLRLVDPLMLQYNEAGVDVISSHTDWPTEPPPPEL